MSTRPKPQKSDRRPSGSVAELAKILNLTRRRVAQLLADGMPVDPQAAVAWRKLHQDTDSAEELRRQRIQLVAAQRERIQTENRVRAAELVPAAQVEASCQQAANIAKMRLLQLAQSLPPQLAGLPEPRMARIIHNAIVECLEHLSDMRSYANEK